MEEKDILFANFIADLVVQKLHNDFDFKLITQENVGMDEELSIDDVLNGELNLEDDMEEKLIAEIARLTTLLTIYEDKEQYEKANIVKNKIRIINQKLNRL